MPLPATAANPNFRPCETVEEITNNQLGPGDTEMQKLANTNPGIAVSMATGRSIVAKGECVLQGFTKRAER